MLFRSHGRVLRSTRLGPRLLVRNPLIGDTALEPTARRLALGQSLHRFVHLGGSLDLGRELAERTERGVEARTDKVCVRVERQACAKRRARRDKQTRDQRVKRFWSPGGGTTRWMLERKMPPEKMERVSPTLHYEGSSVRGSNRGKGRMGLTTAWPAIGRIHCHSVVPGGKTWRPPVPRP